MQALPAYFDQQIANMRAGLARGFSVPRVTLAGRDSSIASFAGKSGADNAFYAPFRDMPSTISSARQAQLRQEAVAAINGSVVPAQCTLRCLSMCKMVL